jgi:predicted DNA-binding transcriptional regulator YafY
LRKFVTIPPILSGFPFSAQKGYQGDSTSYQLVVNQELENILMSHINHIKVLLPQSLKQSLLVKIKKSLQNFS